MGKESIEFRYYEIPSDLPLIALQGEEWIRFYGEDNMHFHNCLEIGYCFYGQGVMCFGKQEVAYGPGAITIIPPNFPHHTYQTNEEPNRWEYLFVDLGRFLKEALPNNRRHADYLKERLNSSMFLIPRGRDIELEVLMKLILEEIRWKKKMYKPCVQALLQPFLIHAARYDEGCAESEDAISEKMEYGVILDVLAYIEEHYMEEFTIQDLADTFDKAELCLTYVTMRKDADKNKDDILKVAVAEDDSWTEGNGSNNGNTSGITWNTKPALTADASSVKTSASYSLGASPQDKPGSGFAVNGARITADITDIVRKAFADQKETLTLVVNESNGYEHYFVRKEGAGEAGYTAATPDMAPSIQLNIPTDIDLEGPSEMTLAKGYAAAETQSFALKGGSGPYTVTLSGNTGNGKITWDAATNQIKVQEGLPVGAYEVTLTSTSSKDAAIQTSRQFTLKVEGIPDPVVTGVSVSPAQASVKQGEGQAFTAEVAGENNPSTEVAWSVSGANSSSTQITEAGMLTVGDDETAKALTVTAISKADPQKSGSASVTVVEKPVTPVEPVKYTITIDANGGTVTPTALEVEEGKPIGALPTPTRTDYTFEGWYTAREGGEKVNADRVVTGNLTLYAHWKADQKPVEPVDPDKEKPKKGEAFTASNGLKYKITAYSSKSKTVTVTGTNKKWSKLAIPDTVQYKGVAFRVTAVGSSAFTKQAGLQSAVIGKYVTSIGTKAFYKDKKLAKVTFQGTAVKTIGKDAFQGIQKGASFVMKQKAFTVGSLKYRITKCTASAKEVTVAGASKKSPASLSIPSTVKYNGMSFKVTAIGTKAFRKQPKLKSVAIGKNVKTIGAYAFSSCKKLSKITFSGTAVKKIGQNAFQNIKKQAVFHVKKSKKASYKKLLQKAKTKNFILKAR